MGEYEAQTSSRKVPFCLSCASSDAVSWVTMLTTDDSRCGTCKTWYGSNSMQLARNCHACDCAPTCSRLWTVNTKCNKNKQINKISERLSIFSRPTFTWHSSVGAVWSPRESSSCRLQWSSLPFRAIQLYKAGSRNEILWRSSVSLTIHWSSSSMVVLRKIMYVMRSSASPIPKYPTACPPACFCPIYALKWPINIHIWSFYPIHCWFDIAVETINTFIQ